ncbi:transcriptional regulator GcvA [Microvirga arsenatis]|uniref:Transcriptional regulator GcvA n=1 Tax=Microvirga arsenatis TaxID=2692265 RepID=A0ABW9Z5L1_9HYPH|nr:transcriptional regulator GcvA [Microvirga arsenatis]NBJ12085.1 transcriptional regulator GcvA [Microvirga arsenatis]NBJ25924.1 transcriptional regulator GcvA [Microvirga arsenatis]
MPKLPSRLPPMSAVRVFEAAARHQSFTRAAEELGMTQAAVSYQIKILEDRVGAPLFVRMPRQVTLTAKGRQLAPAVTEAFDALRAAFAGVEEAVQSVLSITTLTTFAANWLVPRLGRFQQLHPNIAVQINVSGQVAEFAQSEFDLAIRSGNGQWPGLEAHLLFPNLFTPVCSPDLIRGVELREPADILKFPIISPGDPWWQDWFAAAGIENVDLSHRPDNSLGIQQFEGMAAMAGQGFALINPYFFPADLAAGRLVQPFDLLATSERGYWLVYPKARRRSAKIEAFRDWILSEVAGDAERTSALMGVKAGA